MYYFILLLLVVFMSCAQPENHAQQAVQFIGLDVEKTLKNEYLLRKLVEQEYDKKK